MFSEVFYKSPHNYDLDAESERCGEVNNEPSKTIQSMAEDADINVLMKRYGLTGHMPENPRIPEFGDFMEVGDFRSAMEAVRTAESMFMEYPAELRARFLNSPQRFMEFCHDPANAAEMLKLGLRLEPEKKPKPAPMEVIITGQVPAPAPVAPEK